MSKPSLFDTNSSRINNTSRINSLYECFCTLVELKINLSRSVNKILDAKAEKCAKLERYLIDCTIFQTKLKILLGKFTYLGMIITKRTLCTFWLLNMKFRIELFMVIYNVETRGLKKAFPESNKVPK